MLLFSQFLVNTAIRDPDTAGLTITYRVSFFYALKMPAPSGNLRTVPPKKRLRKLKVPKTFLPHSRNHPVHVPDILVWKSFWRCRQVGEEEMTSVKVPESRTNGNDSRILRTYQALLLVLSTAFHGREQHCEAHWSDCCVQMYPVHWQGAAQISPWIEEHPVRGTPCPILLRI